MFTHWSIFGVELKAGKYVGEGLEGSSLEIQLLRHVLDGFILWVIILILDLCIWRRLLHRVDIEPGSTDSKRRIRTHLCGGLLLFGLLASELIP